MEDGGPAFPICPGQDGPMARKFLSRVNAGHWAMDDCWEWTGARTAKGYGVFAPAKRVQFRAHRYAFTLYHGRPPKTMVLHRCDNPACVNPHHLEEGDHGTNMRQMAERKRAAREERHHNSKLGWHEVAAINLLHAAGDYTTRELATMFGVHQATVAGIVVGNLWPDIDSAVNAMLAEREKR